MAERKHNHKANGMLIYKDKNGIIHITERINAE
jgi:hypothetical protein